ncbi:MAG: pseudaminic acid synthase [Pirellulaceae bacterium]|nr:pseudaminic acid synthase [Pirellulaceae bacterium]
MSATISINNREIGRGCPVYIIAELSANHNQSFERAVELVRVAKECGADAVKIQTYHPDGITIDCDNEHFKIKQGTVWDGKTLYRLYEEAYTPWEWQPKLKLEAERLGLDLFSSPFHFEAVDFLEDMQVPAYKIASFELVDIPLLEKVAATGKPVIASTGMATEEEIRLAVDTLRDLGTTQIALLKCTSAYPASPQSMNLRTLAELKNRFDVPVGLSDHSMGLEAPVVAVALGASIIEKHLTLARSDGGPDSSFSLEPQEFAAMVSSVRLAEQVLGESKFGPSEADEKNRAFRRSLFAVRDIAAGEIFTAENVRSIRPGFGLEPRHYAKILGRVATEAIQRGTPLEWRHVVES